MGRSAKSCGPVLVKLALPGPVYDRYKALADLWQLPLEVLLAAMLVRHAGDPLGHISETLRCLVEFPEDSLEILTRELGAEVPTVVLWAAKKYLANRSAGPDKGREAAETVLQARKVPLSASALDIAVRLAVATGDSISGAIGRSLGAARRAQQAVEGKKPPLQHADQTGGAGAETQPAKKVKAAMPFWP